ncbi:SAV_2336 N-terminal domain-related protein [Streptomyces sp. RTGN2]|uniref:SAV_2336 N-terminal domain-related protein n=1 Tax=Streptomyces sp. RTGN2 TaxID=3016525 RepID=UPI002556D1FE|nr:SAV_2336 N-terminal domain-related protein [Streptomyces sp. RTGN2]
MTGGGARLAEALRVLSACGHELDADQLLDVLWLARSLPAGPGAPLHREQPRSGPPAPGTGPEPDRVSLRRPTPEPDDRDLPDLTAPSLYAAARQAPVPEPSPAHPGRDSRKAMPVRVPEEKALPDELELGRALRPLRRRRDSRHHLEIDEELTAAEFAQTGLVDVVQRPVRERWLNLVLLVDDGLSMLLWHRLGAELRTLLERLGAFSTTRVLGLDASDVRPRLHARPFRSDGPELPLSTVNDPSGRTLLLVVSDGMGASWRSGAMHALLAERAARGPVAVLHTLPSGMWEASGISAELWQATTRRIGGANSSWQIVDPVLPPGIARFEGVPVPVLAPDASSLRDWARLLASPGTTVELPLLVRPGRYGAAAQRSPDSAQHFRDAATPEAYRLAAHLAAVSPLSVPVMRLVQSAVPWKASTTHLAEVFLGGLIRPHPAPVPGPLPAKHRVFDFSEESKAVLLDAIPPAELLRTSRRIGRRLDELAGNSPDFPAWLSHPDGSAQLPGSHQPFTSVERRLLTRFGVSFGEPSPGIGPDPEREATPDADSWGPLLPEDPRRLGDFVLRGRRRGHRTVVYQGFDAQRTEAALRVPRPDLPGAGRLIEVEAEALARLQGQYAPTLLATGTQDGAPWLAMTTIADQSPQDAAQPPRLDEIFSQALTEGVAPFDTLRGLLVSFYLANALALCHINGLVPADFTADGVFVLRRTVVLANLSDCVVDGEYLEPGPVPTREDNVHSLGGLLQLISSKAGWDMPNLPEGMHLWQGDTWEQLRRLVLRCIDADPALRPTASEVAEVLGKYIARTRPRREGAGTPYPPASVRRLPTAPLDLPPRDGTSPSDGPGPRLARFGSARRNAEEQLERLRVPLSHGRRLTLVGPYHYSGRATTTMVLGNLLAAVRGEPVLALDAAASVGSLDPFLVDRNRAVLRNVAELPHSASYDEVRARTTRLPSGLEVIAHHRGHISTNPTHAQDYAQVLMRTAPYYPFVLSDWAPLHLNEPANVLLDHTDTLIICCSSTDVSLVAAADALAGVRGAGRAHLADSAIIVVTEVDGRRGRRLPDGLAPRLRIDPDHVVHIPFDAALQSASWDLGRLRPATTEAFLGLAELVLPPVAGPSP